MKRVNFRAVVDRFTHIDGEIVSADVSFKSQGEVAKASVVVRFYAWWEHPLYVAARDADAPWAFDYDDDAEREMLIEATSPRRCDVRAGCSATDLAFYSEHPTLWEFEDVAQIICNSDFEPRVLIDALLERGIPHVDLEVLSRYIAPYAAHKAPYSLGYFPFTLFGRVKAELQQMGVRIFIAREPAPRPSLVAMSIDDTIMIVAEDFFLDVPEFEHRSEWFRPRDTLSNRDDG